MGPWAYSKSGGVNLNNSSDNLAGSFWVGGNGDGVLDIYDSQGNVTISAVGQTGHITAKRVKTSEQIIELFDGATPFYSGSKVFDYDGYNSLTVIAKVTSTSSFNLITIPVKFLESTDKRFCISDEINYVVVRFSIDTTTNKITMTWDSRNSTGYVDRVYGNY